MTKKKATKIIEKVKREYPLHSDSIWRIIELCQRHPRWSVDRIFEEALAPRMRTSVILPLTPDMKVRLQKAEKQYDMRIGDIVYHALDEWLRGHDF